MVKVYQTALNNERDKQIFRNGQPSSEPNISIDILKR